MGAVVTVQAQTMKSIIGAIALFVLAWPPSSFAAQVTIRWTFASQNMDGTPLTDLAGAKVYYGTSSSNYTHVLDVPGGLPGQTVSHTVTGLVAGATYYLNGTAYNTAGLESDFCTEASKVASEDYVLQANAGADGVAQLASEYSLNGSIATENPPEGTTLTITWSQVSGPGAAMFADPNSAVTSVVFSQPGQYTLRLTATDGTKTATDEAVIDVQNYVTPGLVMHLRVQT